MYKYFYKRQKGPFVILKYFYIFALSKIDYMFNKETEYALRGLVYIQIQNNSSLRPGIDEIAAEIKAPRFFVAKILQRMVRQGFLISIKGKGGGFLFERDKPDLSIKEVITSIQGDSIITGCGFGLSHCSNDNPCPLHDKYAPIREAIDNLVSTETIQSLAAKKLYITIPK
jgi:Rrf2 family protein